MPRGRGGQFQGVWRSYADGSNKYLYPPDEERVADVIDEMFSMCGNAGQEAMIGDYLTHFDDWAMNALEAEGYSMTWEQFGEMVREDWYDGRYDKWRGTNLIWARGFAVVADQSGYHDAYDETGEGVGDEFSG